MSQISAGEDASLIPDLVSPEDVGLPKDQTPSEQQDIPSCPDDTAPVQPKPSLAGAEDQEAGEGGEEGSPVTSPLSPQDVPPHTQAEGLVAECGESVSLEPDGPAESEVQLMWIIVMLGRATTASGVASVVMRNGMYLI